MSTGEKHGEKKLRKLREEEDVSKSKVRFRNYYWTGREERDRKRGRRVRWKIVAGIKVYRSFSEITEMHTYIYIHVCIGCGYIRVYQINNFNGRIVYTLACDQTTWRGDASCGILERPIDLVGYESPTAAMTAAGARL